MELKIKYIVLLHHFPIRISLSRAINSRPPHPHPPLRVPFWMVLFNRFNNDGSKESFAP